MYVFLDSVFASWWANGGFFFFFRMEKKMEWRINDKKSFLKFTSSFEWKNLLVFRVLKKIIFVQINFMRFFDISNLFPCDSFYWDDWYKCYKCFYIIIIYHPTSFRRIFLFNRWNLPQCQLYLVLMALCTGRLTRLIKVFRLGPELANIFVGFHEKALLSDPENQKFIFVMSMIHFVFSIMKWKLIYFSLSSTIFIQALSLH